MRVLLALGTEILQSGGNLRWIRAERGDHGAAYRRLIFADFLRLVVRPLVVRFRLQDHGGRVLPMRRNGDNRKEHADDGNPYSDPFAESVDFMGVGNLNLGHPLLQSKEMAQVARRPSMTGCLTACSAGNNPPASPSSKA